MDWGYLFRAGLGIPDYWHPHVEIQPGFEVGDLRQYPVSVEGKAEYPGELDRDGIPIVYWGPNGSAAPSPVNIILYGLGSYEAFLNTGNEMYGVQTQCVLRWLERNARAIGPGVGWPYQVDFPPQGLRAPWSSGIVQGFALSLLLRAQKQQFPGPWKELTSNCWRGFHASIEDGGFCRKTPAGVIYEEYPGAELDCVFNGVCYALIALWEAAQSGFVDGARADFDRGLAGLRPLLPKFACGHWSLYSLSSRLGRPMLASPYYHHINGLLACVVGRMSGHQDFTEYGERWLRADSPTRRIAISLRIGVERFLASPSMLQRDKSKKVA